MTMVEQRNERWRAADLAVTRARESRAEQRGLLWPTVGVTGRYAHFNHELFVDLSALHDLLPPPTPGASTPPLSATVLKNDPARVSLGASWTVFAGGRIRAANRAAEAGVAAADAERSGARQVLTTELVDRYFKRRLAADVLNVRRQALETLERHVQDAQRLEQAGQIARTESLRAQVARAEADRDYKVAARDVALASAALKATLGPDQVGGRGGAPVEALRWVRARAPGGRVPTGGTRDRDAAGRRAPGRGHAGAIPIRRIRGGGRAGWPPA